ncbi:hypothetical protein MCUN1_000511 [Malassezia cuniculi]|uniref:Uncharacterized protein n=1 Tax=Malassezia cuniculi TaxID=948313 RepID=A0AAF0EW18_9BASI|nr:hypothetical protein MCUN1_000511 [Malassezia cuniculi]
MSGQPNISVVSLYFVALRNQIEAKLRAAGVPEFGGVPPPAEEPSSAEAPPSEAEHVSHDDHQSETKSDEPEKETLADEAAEQAEEKPAEQDNEGAQALARALEALAAIPPTPEVPPMRPFQVVPELLRWRLVHDGPAAGGWTRLLWSNELYQERRSITTYRAEDMVTVTKVQIPSTMDPERFVELLRGAMIKLRFTYPMTAVTIEYGTTECANHPAFVYRVPKSYDDLEKWCKDTLSIERPRDETPLDDLIEQLRLGLISNQLDIAKNTRRIHLILSGHPDEQHTVAFVSHCTHATTDAYSELTIIRALLEYVADLDCASGPDDDVLPQHLPWGEEVDSLTPVLQDLVGYDLKDVDSEAAVAIAGRVIAGYSLRLDPYKAPGIGRIHTERTQLVFTPEQTNAIHVAARSKGFTMTQVVDAARHMAYMEMRRSYIENPDVEKYETLHTNFMMPFEVRKRFAAPWNTRKVVCNTTTGFSTVIPLMEPYFERADSELARHDVELKDLSQVQTLCRTAEKLKEQYLKAYDDFEKLIKAQPPLGHMGGILEDFYPPPDPSPEGFSSVGVLENMLPREIDIPTHEEPFRPIDWYVSLSMSRHIASVHMTLHMWTHLDQMHLSIVYADTYKRDFIVRFLESIRISLLLFARAYAPSN